MNILYVTYLFNGLLMIAMPLGLAFYLTRRFELKWRLWWIGATTFVLSQIGHIPFNALMGLWLNQTSLATWPEGRALIFNAVFLGLSAGLWEELSRYAMYRWWAKDARSWRTGVLTGAGHGGIEAIILGVVVLAAYVGMIIMKNMDLASMLPADQLEATRQAIATYWSANWYDTLLGAVERLFAVCLQVGFAVIVLQTFTRRQWWWVWVAVALHALVDATAVYGIAKLGIYWTEGIVAVYAAIGLAAIFLLRRPEPDQDDPVPAPVVEADSAS